MSDYYDLGKHTRAISTSSADAQMWFDRGLNWTYGFNHEEAMRCFEFAIEADPDCPMAHWGLAYAAGPNYNKPWKFFNEADLAQTLPLTFNASQRALALLDNASPAEQALITALQARYQSPDVPDGDDPLVRLDAWTDDYANAMRPVYNDFGADLDVATLFAESLMNRTPWQLWDLPAAAPAEGASTVEAMEVLERALATPESHTHPGALHMYIHLMEMSPFPERALRAGDRLRPLVPDSGHLAHMPTHIDVLCGHYHNVVEWNHAAIVADRKFLERDGGMNFYTLYRVHNCHFKMYGAMFLGQRDTALDAADELNRSVPTELLEIQVPPMADWIEAYLALKPHVQIRFGMWQEIIDEPLPEDQELRCTLTVMLHYAKSVAYSATGRVAEAEEEQARFEAAVARVPESRYLSNNMVIDILAIAREMLAGELEYRKGNYAAAFAHLRQSIDLEDTLPYDEPWGWMQPTRHAYGALLLEQGHVEEAEAVYRADLGLDDSLTRACQHPENVWALHGYHECLLRLGKPAEARMIKQRLDLAAARSDVPIKASCYCRMTALAAD